ncbi:MAG TPA: S26 family signal peptidase [Rariglobus sp.]|nr:S26 family signal peptidase [Rariglobus sp.]
MSAPESCETRRSSAIAPSSGVSLQEAEKVAAEVQRAVPGTTVFMVNPTGSMRPLFDGNCLLLTEKAAFGSLEIGDIVVFLHSHTGKLIVHRILERRSAGYWAKGDHNERMDDDLITETNYCGWIYGIIYTAAIRREHRAVGAEKPAAVCGGAVSGIVSGAGARSFAVGERCGVLRQDALALTGITVSKNAHA